MIEQEGTVIGIEGDFARVRAQRQSACGHCQVADTCGTSLLARLFGRHPAELRVANHLGAAVGERVVLGIAEQDLLNASLAAYLAPLTGLIGGAACGEWIAPVIAGAPAQWPSLLGAALGFIMAMLWVRRWSARAATDPRRQPMLLRRVAPSIVEIAPPAT